MEPNEALTRWTLEVSATHPSRRDRYNAPQYKFVDQLYTPDGRRVWVSFGGENTREQSFPEIREEPFITVGNVSIEDDSTTTFNILTACGNVIRSVNTSTREREFVGELLESPRPLEPDEIEELYELVQPLFSRLDT
jgi:hypothetical protein